MKQRVNQNLHLSGEWSNPHARSVTAGNNVKCIHTGRKADVLGQARLYDVLSALSGCEKHGNSILGEMQTSKLAEEVLRRIRGIIQLNGCAGRNLRNDGSSTNQILWSFFAIR